MYQETILFTAKTSQFANSFKFIFTGVLVFLLIYFSNFVNPIVFAIYEIILNTLNQNHLIENYNYSYFLYFTFFILFIYNIKHILNTYYTKYYFDKDRLIIKKGILNRKKSYIEYFRIRDYNITRPLTARLLGRCNLSLITTDRTHPNKKLKLINHFYENEIVFRETINKIVSESGRGREIDVV